MTTVRTRKKTKKASLKKINRIAFVLDSSGSMRGLERPTIDAFNRNLKDIQENAKKTKQETTVSLVIFGDPDVRVQFENMDAADVLPLKAGDYRPSGGTPLRSAVNDTVGLLPRPSDAKKDASYVVITITDGEENQSTVSRATVAAALKSLQATDRWTFAFQVPRGARYRIASEFGVPDGSVIEWDQTAAGVFAASTSNTHGLSNYYAARSSGMTSVKSFYTADSADLTKTDLKKLVDISSQVKVWNVAKEAPIKEFVESKNREYINGAAYYQLSKDEKNVQSYKQVLLQHKTSGKVFGGEAARTLIGLPATANGSNAKVKIDNRGDYDIFIQSTSVNRKLPRGTRLIFRLDHTTPSSPTWTATK